MIDLNAIINTIIKDWWLLGFFFTLGGIWWQGKAWFNGIDKKLDDSETIHTQQLAIITALKVKVDSMEESIKNIENQLFTVHEEVHDQEVKIAVLESKL